MKPKTPNEYYKLINKNNYYELNESEKEELNKICITYINYLEGKTEPEKITITKNKNRSYNYYSENNTFKNIRLKQLKQIIAYKSKNTNAYKMKNYRDIKAFCKNIPNFIVEFIDEEETLIV